MEKLYLPRQEATTKANPCWPTVFPAPRKDSELPTVSRKIPNGTKNKIIEVIRPRRTLKLLSVDMICNE